MPIRLMKVRSTFNATVVTVTAVTKTRSTLLLSETSSRRVLQHIHLQELALHGSYRSQARAEAPRMAASDSLSWE